MIEQITAAEFEARTTQASIVVVDFFALWCGPCRMIQPVLEEYSERLAADEKTAGKVAFFKVDVDQCTDLSAKLGISAMPTFLIYKDGQLVKTVIGANMEGIKEAVQDNLAITA